MSDEQYSDSGPRDWSEEAKGLLKAELKRRNMTYAALADALKAVGVSETEANLRNKISRGNFSAAFFLQALDAIGCAVLYLNTDGLARGRANIGEGVRMRLRQTRDKVEKS